MITAQLFLEMCKTQIALRQVAEFEVRPPLPATRGPKGTTRDQHAKPRRP